jgi:1,2-dihydroxy-3-keto-5-methylthiopentene dioxygenase
MPSLTLHDIDGAAARPPVNGIAAQHALRELGIASGRWALQAQPVSRTPQLTYARELQALQQRCASVLTDRVRERPHAQRGDPRQQLSAGWPDTRDEHAHGDAEVRVVLAGSARWLLRAPSAGLWLAVVAEAGDWLALPAGTPHTFEASASQGVDLLRLFARPGGWVPERTGARLPQRLARWDEAANTAALAWAA